MNKFPNAKLVLKAEMARDAEFALNLAAFFEGLSSEEPDARDYGMTDDRATEIALQLKAA